MEKETKHIVLVGGGYASIWAYRSLVRELLIEIISGRVKISVVCPEEYHFYHGWTAESLMGIIQDENRMSPLSEIFHFAELIKGRAVGLNPDSQILNVQMINGSGVSICFDQLFLGIGTYDSTSITGLKEYAYPLKSHRDFMRAKMRIEWMLQEATRFENLKPQKKIQNPVRQSNQILL